MTDLAQTVQAGTGTATPTPQPSAPTTPQTGAAQENPQETAPQYVTVEQLSQVTEQIVSRLKQSDRDRTQRINSEIEQIKARLEVTGVQLAPEQELKLRNKIGDEIDQPDDTQAAGPASPAAPADQLIAQFVGDIFKEAGTEVTRNDPEWAELQTVLDANFNNPKGHIKVTKAAFAAAEKKAQRIASNSESAAARVIGGGGSTQTGNADPTSAHDAWGNAYK